MNAEKATIISELERETTRLREQLATLEDRHSCAAEARKQRDLGVEEEAGLVAARLGEAEANLALKEKELTALREAGEAAKASRDAAQGELAKLKAVVDAQAAAAEQRRRRGRRVRVPAQALPARPAGARRAGGGPRRPGASLQRAERGAHRALRRVLHRRAHRGAGRGESRARRRGRQCQSLHSSQDTLAVALGAADVFAGYGLDTDQGYRIAGHYL